jgi:hypothetical protein
VLIFVTNKVHTIGIVHTIGTKGLGHSAEQGGNMVLSKAKEVP